MSGTEERGRSRTEQGKPSVHDADVTPERKGAELDKGASDHDADLTES